MHQAALGSVPRSVDDPRTTNAINITGTLNLFDAAQRAGVRRIVYAGSSSAYGDSPVLPKEETHRGDPYLRTQSPNTLENCMVQCLAHYMICNLSH